jgi:hypothetical protein
MRETRFSDFEPGGRGFDPAGRASKFRAVRCEGSAGFCVLPLLG